MADGLKSVLAGIVAAGLCVGVAAWSNAKDLTGRRAELKREAHVVGLLVATRIRGGLEKHLTAMRQMANFYASSRKVGEKQFLKYAANTLRMSPACLNIAYVDPGLHVIRTYPPEDNRWTRALDARGRSSGYRTVARASRTAQPLFSPPMRLFGRTWGFVLAEPIITQGRLLGTLVGACRSQEYFGAMVLPEVTERYDQVVLHSGTPIFTSNASRSSEKPALGDSEQFEFAGASWEVGIRPQEWVVRDRLDAGRPMFWTMVALLALGCGALAALGTHRAMRMSAHIRSQGVALQEVKTLFDGTREQLIQAEKMTALGQLVAGVAHEINNPLTGIMGYSQLLIKQGLPRSIQEKLLTISREAERMAKIVRNLLSFARRHVSEKQVLNLNTVVEETLGLKAYHLRARQIQILKELDPTLPSTLFDFHQLQQVLINLLNNAEQAMVEAGRGRTIRLVTRPIDGKIELRVSDDGPGITLEDQDRIFEPFWTTKPEGEGSGLGLSLCRGIVEEHGGTIRVESAPGEGATFIIELPIQRAHTQVSVDETRSPGRTPPRMKVLVVDDEASVKDFLAEVLALGGHHVDTASDVPEAIRKVAGGNHDLIISDLMMPQGTGLDIYQAVLLNRPDLARRIVFITGQVASDETLEFLRKTGNELLLKPCRIDDIQSAIARAANN